ncbi:unnamed protein product, partial [Rotaria sp. Silwood2]
MNTRNQITRKSRWEELKETVKIILNIGTVFDPNGVDGDFLNRKCHLNVNDPNKIDVAFTRRPVGYSRLAPALDYIFKLDAAKPGADKHLLVFVATDAEPTNESDKVDLKSLENIMTD